MDEVQREARRSARTRLVAATRAQTPDGLLEDHGIVRPAGWSLLSYVEKLDFIGGRILADSRTTTSHTEMKDEGYLSVSQEERRRAREVYGSATFDEIPPQRGVFSRAYREKW